MTHIMTVIILTPISSIITNNTNNCSVQRWLFMPLVFLCLHCWADTTGLRHDGAAGRDKASLDMLSGIRFNRILLAALCQPWER